MSFGYCVLLTPRVCKFNNNTGPDGVVMLKVASESRLTIVRSLCLYSWSPVYQDPLWSILWVKAQERWSAVKKVRNLFSISSTTFAMKTLYHRLGIHRTRVSIINCSRNVHVSRFQHIWWQSNKEFIHGYLSLVCINDQSDFSFPNRSSKLLYSPPPCMPLRLRDWYERRRDADGICPT